MKNAREMLTTLTKELADARREWAVMCSPIQIANDEYWGTQRAADASRSKIQSRIVRLTELIEICKAAISAA